MSIQTNTDRNNRKRSLPQNGSPQKKGNTILDGVSLDKTNEYFDSASAVRFYQGLQSRWREAAKINDYDGLVYILGIIPYLDETWSRKRDEMIELLQICKTETNSSQEAVQYETPFGKIEKLRSKIGMLKALIGREELPYADALGAVVDHPHLQEMISKYQDDSIYRHALTTAVSLSENELLKTENELKDRGIEFERYLIDVNTATSRVATILNALSGFNQANISVHGSTTKKAIEAGKGVVIQEFVGQAPQKASDGDLYRDVMKNPRRIDEILKLPLDFDGETQQKLADIANKINQSLSGATFVGKKKEKRECKHQKIKGTIRSIDQWIIDDSKKPKNLHALRAEGDELDCVQPWLSFIINAVGRCLPSFIETNNELPKRPSPTKKSRCKTATILQTESRHKRENDIMLGVDSIFNKIIVDDAIQVPGEMKPESRKTQGPNLVHHQGDDQGIASAAKCIAIPFNFAGVGLKSKSTYLVMTPSFIQINQLQTVNIGTPSADVVLFRSEKYPFFKPDYFDKYIKSSDNPKQFDELKMELYKTNSADYSQPPSGYLVLASLMMLPRAKLFGPCLPDEDGILGPFLGSGAFSMVFVHKGDDQQVVKLSRYGRKMVDGEILQRLKDDRPFTILNFIEDVTLDTNIGGFTFQLPAVILEPRGQPLLSELRGGECVEKLTETVHDDMMEALGYLHGNNILHRDVKPSNIIICKRDGNRRAVLVDFSVAGALETADKEDKVIGFVGTRNFAHRDVFAFYPNSPYKGNIQFDFVGLGYTLAVLMNNGQLPWEPVVDYPRSLEKAEEWNVFSASMDKRLSSAVDSMKPERKRHGNVLQRFLQRYNEQENACESIAEKVIKLLRMNDTSTLGKVGKSKQVTKVTTEGSQLFTHHV